LMSVAVALTVSSFVYSANESDSMSELTMYSVVALANQTEIPTETNEPKESYSKHDCTLIMSDGETMSDPYWTCEKNGDDECCMPVESMCQFQ